MKVRINVTERKSYLTIRSEEPNNKGAFINYVEKACLNDVEFKIVQNSYGTLSAIIYGDMVDESYADLGTDIVFHKTKYKSFVTKKTKKTVYSAVVACVKASIKGHKISAAL